MLTFLPVDDFSFVRATCVPQPVWLGFDLSVGNRGMKKGQTQTHREKSGGQVESDGVAPIMMSVGVYRHSISGCKQLRGKGCSY